MSMGGGGSQTQTTKSEPWEAQQPYLRDIYTQAQNQFNRGPLQFFPNQTYADPTDTQLEAERLQKEAATGASSTLSSSLIPAFQSQLQSPTQIFSDPMFQDSLRASLTPIEESTSRLLQQARRGATGAGQLGGTRQGILEAEVLKDMLTKQSDVASKMYGDIYGDIARNQAVTLGLAPQIMSTLAAPSQLLGQVGNIEQARNQQAIDDLRARFEFGQQAPGQALSQYANLAAGSIIPGTTTQTAPRQGGNPLMGLLGAGLGSFFGPTGATIGASLGSQF
jgi:hypothetical protein